MDNTEPEYIAKTLYSEHAVTSGGARIVLSVPIRDALRHELSWTHYRMIMKIENPNARKYYLEESAKGVWSTRQLERQINSFCYERVLRSCNGRFKAEEAPPFCAGHYRRCVWFTAHRHMPATMKNMFMQRG
ncbi:MAG: DUF1016 N-terminal domain-containing protein [Clostridiales bacterium]|jgi:hypothetical protein|nr:DUF1016 N-terminal domain-containing protein [Clostridiales bacterium]